MFRRSPLLLLVLMLMLRSIRVLRDDFLGFVFVRDFGAAARAPFFFRGRNFAAAKHEHFLHFFHRHRLVWKTLSSRWRNRRWWWLYRSVLRAGTTAISSTTTATSSSSSSLSSSFLSIAAAAALVLLVSRTPLAASPRSCFLPRRSFPLYYYSSARRRRVHRSKKTLLKPF